MIEGNLTAIIGLGFMGLLFVLSMIATELSYIKEALRKMLNSEDKK